MTTITMPIVLTRDLSPNGRPNWRQKASVVKRTREEARRATVSWLNTPGSGLDAYAGDTTPTILDVEISWPRGRRTLDDDNARASLKCVIDGIADGLWDGSDAHVRVGTVHQVRGTGGLTFRLRHDNE